MDNTEIVKKSIVGYRDSRYKCESCCSVAGKFDLNGEFEGYFCNKHQFPVSFSGCCDGWTPEQNG